MARYARRAARIAALVVPLWFAAPAAAEDLADVRKLLEIAPNRNMGSPDRKALDDYVAARFKATGFECGEITFPTAIYVPGDTQLRLPDGADLPLYNMMPDTVQPGNLEESSWSGKLVDAGAGTPEEMQGEWVADSAVLLDMNSRKAWVTALELGAKILIFAGSKADNGREGSSKLCKAPLSAPRFYLTYADARKLREAMASSGRERAGGGKSIAVTISQKQRARWEYGVARNNWVVVPGGAHGDQVVHLQAYKDASSFVPAISPGAESAANLALLLRLLDYYAKNQPQCTLVFSAVSDHCNNLRGEEFYLGSLFQDEGAVADELETRRSGLAEAKFYSKVYADTSPQQIARLRSESSSEAGPVLFLKAPIYEALNYSCNKARHRIAQISSLLEGGELSEPDRVKLGSEAEVRRKELEDLIAIMALFQRFGARVEFQQLSPERQRQVVALMNRMAADFDRQAADLQRDLAEFEANARLRKLLEGKRPLLYISLDVTFGAERMGFFFQGGDYKPSDEPDMEEWRDALGLVARDSVAIARALPGGDRWFADTMQNAGGVYWRNHLADQFAMACTIGGCVSVPSITLTTTDDPRDLVFTPSDTLDNLDTGRMARMTDFAGRLLKALLDYEGLPTATRPLTGKNYEAVTFRYNLRLIDPYSVEIPTEPARNAAVLVTQLKTISPAAPVWGQVTSYQIALTDHEGAALFRAHPGVGVIEAYGFDPETGRINCALDAGEGERRLHHLIDPTGERWVWDDHTALLFDCVQTDLVGLYDPASRTAIPTSANPKIILLDGLRESSPDHYGIAGIEEERTTFAPMLADEGVACLFTEPDMRIKVVSNKLLLIHAAEERPTGNGYLPGDGRLRMISYTAAKDVQLLNGGRAKRLEDKGVRNSGASELYKTATALIAEAETARTQGREEAFLGKAIEGLSSAMRSYLMVRATTMDLIKAVAVFLALVIPFCMFLTKLVAPWTGVRAQIASFLVLFGVMALGLALLHPAFSLSQTPMMVLLAFAMVGLAVFVMFILHARFDAGLRRLVEEAQGVESSESSRKTLAGAAFSVGVNNMRRRRIRTTLTAATIVLVTFTMLSVISIGQSLAPYRRRTESKSPYDGVLFAKAGMSPISESEADHVWTLLSPYGQVVRRSWTQRLDVDGGYMPILLRYPQGETTKQQGVLAINSLLGVQLAENGFLEEMPLAAGRWFSSDDAREIIVTVRAASYLGVKTAPFTPQDVILRNQPLKLVGLLDDGRVAALYDLAGVSLIPLASQPDPSTHKFTETGETPISAEDALAGPVPGASPLPPQDCALVPINYALSLPDTSYRAIAMKAKDSATAWRAAEHFTSATALVDTTANLTYTGVREPVILPEGGSIQAGQYSLGSPVGMSIGGASKVVIPICLAATIILNTMLGAVMERRKEISVYNSIGLNPTHVFVFFVAEALVFGLVGSVSGYLIGQALGRVIVEFHWLPGVNLNYSSMAVMVVIFAAIGTVIISTVYPAFLATRASVPSGQRRWKLPAPAGDELWLDFPFSFS